MILSEMFTILNTYVDDVISPSIATPLLNAGQNKMAAEVRGLFPPLVATDTNSTFVFPEKYHEIPILYAAAMIKAQDSSIREKESFLGQFQDGLKSFTENYDLPQSLRDDINSQQFIAEEGQTSFLINKDTFTPFYSTLTVFKNDVKVLFSETGDGGFDLETAASLDDKITATWTTNETLEQPPYPWQGAW